MLKATVKLMLRSYRAGSEDAQDPFFKEALRAAQDDPELGDWFKDEQRFDAVIAGKLRELPAPADLKDLILLNARSPRFRSFSRARASYNARPWLAAAAAVVLAFLLGRLTVPGAQSLAGGQAAGGDPLALQAISYTGRMPALQFVCFDAKAVAQWIDEKSATLKMGKLLSKPMYSMQMIGSSTAEWGGKPVMMVALQHDGQMGMLYLLRAADFPAAAAGIGTITEKDGWVSKTGRRGDHLYVLATKGTRKDLDFPMPW